MAATELVVYFEGEMPTKVSRVRGRGDEIVSKLPTPGETRNTTSQDDGSFSQLYENKT